MSVLIEILDYYYFLKMTQFVLGHLFKKGKYTHVDQTFELKFKQG
jgi:hypothetical protein